MVLSSSISGKEGSLLFFEPSFFLSFSDICIERSEEEGKGEKASFFSLLMHQPTFILQCCVPLSSMDFLGEAKDGGVHVMEFSPAHISS